MIHRLLSSGAGLVFAMIPVWDVLAAAKKPPAQLDGKKVVALARVPNIQIEMPDQSLHNFGEDFQASLTTQLMQSGRYLVADPLASPKIRAQGVPFISSEFVWNGSYTPAVTVR